MDDNVLLRFKIGDRNYEVLIIRERDGTLIKGVALFEKCKKLWANTDREDCEFIFNHRDEIPIELQDFVLVFPKYFMDGLTVSLSKDVSVEDSLSNSINNSCVGCLVYDEEKWGVWGFPINPKSTVFGDEWYEQCCFVRRCA